MQNLDRDSGIDFYDAQQNVGDPFFLFTIQLGGVTGGGVSCYFWYESAEQLLNSIKNHLDFWNWHNGTEKASAEISKIIDSYKKPGSLDSELRSMLSDYTHKNAGVHFWAWGSFGNLCYDQSPFSIETRREFREWCEETDQFSFIENAEDELKATDAILDIELNLFKDFLSQSPT